MFKRPLSLAALAAVVATGLAIIAMPDAQAAPANPVAPQADPTTTGSPSSDAEPPTTPTNLTVSYRCDGNLGVLLTLNWTASTDNIGVTGYDIYSAPYSSDSFTLVTTTTTTSYTQRLSGVSKFEVRARDAAGNTSDFTAPISIFPPPSPCPTYPASASPSASVSPPSHGTCAAAYSLVNIWPGGFQGQATVTNTGTTATSSWAVTITFANGVTISQVWGASTKDTASPYTFNNLAYNGVLAPSASTTFGFVASSTGTNTILGVSCTRTP